MRLCSITLCGGLAVILVSTAAMTQEALLATFVSLGHIPGGEFLSEASDITPGGQVVVGYSASHDGPPASLEPFRWTRNMGMVGLGHPNPGYGLAVSVSTDGAVVAGFQSVEMRWEAFRWTKDGGRAPLNGIPLGFHSFATDMSADGSVIAGYVYGPQTGAPRFRAFRWTAASGAVLLTADFLESVTTGISSDGSVTLGYVLGEHGPESFRWTADAGVVRLGDPPNKYEADIPQAASADGSTVVGTLIYGLQRKCEAYRWTTNSGFKPLGDHLPNGTCNGAYAVSGNGRIVGGASAVQNASGTIIGEEAFIWTPAKGIRRLQDVLTKNFRLNLDGWRLGHISAISSDRTSVAMAGGGINPAGHLEAWKVVLPRVQRVDIDIMPGSDINKIFPWGRGMIPVAILSTHRFDARSEVDQKSLTFGRTGDEDSLATCHAKDINDDDSGDLVCDFRTESTGFQCGDVQGVLRGERLDGTTLEGLVGTDSIYVRCK